MRPKTPEQLELFPSPEPIGGDVRLSWWMQEQFQPCSVLASELKFQVRTELDSFAAKDRPLLYAELDSEPLSVEARTTVRQSAVRLQTGHIVDIALLRKPDSPHSYMGLIAMHDVFVPLVQFIGENEDGIPKGSTRTAGDFLERCDTLRFGQDFFQTSWHYGNEADLVASQTADKVAALHDILQMPLRRIGAKDPLASYWNDVFVKKYDHRPVRFRYDFADVLQAVQQARADNIGVDLPAQYKERYRRGKKQVVDSSDLDAALMVRAKKALDAIGRYNLVDQDAYVKLAMMKVLACPKTGAIDEPLMVEGIDGLERYRSLVIDDYGGSKTVAPKLTAYEQRAAGDKRSFTLQEELAFFTRYFEGVDRLNVAQHDYVSERNKREVVDDDQLQELLGALGADTHIFALLGEHQPVAESIVNQAASFIAGYQSRRMVLQVPGVAMQSGRVDYKSNLSIKLSAGKITGTNGIEMIATARPTSMSGEHKQLFHVRIDQVRGVQVIADYDADPFGGVSLTGVDELLAHITDSRHILVAEDRVSNKPYMPVQPVASVDLQSIIDDELSDTTSVMQEVERAATQGHRAQPAVVKRNRWPNKS